MSDCSLEIGTGGLLDLLGQPARVHVALGSQLPRDGEDLFQRRLSLDLADVPQRAPAELRERTPIERDDGWRRGVGECGLVCLSRSGHS